MAGCSEANPVVAGRSPPHPPLAIITDKVVGLSYPKFALLATRGLLLKAFMEEQRTILARKTYALDTARWHGNYCVKSAETTSYVQYRLMQQSRVPPRTPPCHRYIALAHIAYGGLGGHTCETLKEKVE